MIRQEFQCLEGWDKNSSGSKNKITIPMSGTITKEIYCLEPWDKNSDVWKDKIRILMFGRIR